MPSTMTHNAAGRFLQPTAVWRPRRMKKRKKRWNQSPCSSRPPERNIRKDKPQHIPQSPRRKKIYATCFSSQPPPSGLFAPLSHRCGGANRHLLISTDMSIPPNLHAQLGYHSRWYGIVYIWRPIGIVQSFGLAQTCSNGFARKNNLLHQTWWV